MVWCNLKICRPKIFMLLYLLNQSLHQTRENKKKNSWLWCNSKNNAEWMLFLRKWDKMQLKLVPPLWVQHHLAAWLNRRLKSSICNKWSLTKELKRDSQKKKTLLNKTWWKEKWLKCQDNLLTPKNPRMISKQCTKLTYNSNNNNRLKLHHHQE
jgi:hypothetical protein